jgi:universal stress protein A
VTFRKILVPVDLTVKNEGAVETARDLAIASGGTVTLLHIIETLDLPFEELREFYDVLQARALAHMDGLSATLRDAGIPFDVHVIYGDRTERIVRFASESKCDLIVMDSHRVEPGRPGRGPTTISYRVAVLAQCPVLLVKGGERKDS